MEASGRIFEYGDNVDTDVIIPTRYLDASDPKELVMHCARDIDPDLTKKVEKGDIIVANKNFGCGSSREHAPAAIKESGVSCAVASTFVRIFYRNAIDIGLPIAEYEEAVESIDAGDGPEIDFTVGVINNKSKKREYKDESFPEPIQKIINSNELVNYIKSEKVKDEEGES